MIVERPPGLVASRHCEADGAYRVVNAGCQNCQCAAVLIASDHDGHLRPCDPRAEMVGPSAQLRLGQMVPTAARDYRDLVVGAARVAQDFAPDASSRGSSEVRPQRVATASAQVVRMVLRQNQHPSAEPILEDPQPALIEIPVESLPGTRFREDHIFPGCSKQERDQRHESSRPHNGCHESCQEPRTSEASVEWQGTRGRKPRAPVAEPPIWLRVWCAAPAVAGARRCC